MEVTHWHSTIHWQSTIQNLCCQKEEFAFLRRGNEDFEFFMNLHDFYNFTNAYTAAPSTIMSAASMFTGNNTFKIARNYNDWKINADKPI